MNIQNQLITNVLTSMQTILSEDQLNTLHNTLLINLHDYELQERSTELSILDNVPDAMLKKFIATKRLEGKSSSTLKRYYEICYMLIHTFQKPVYEITTDDLRYYLAVYKEKRNVQNRTLDGIRRCLSSFFSWLSAEGLIGTNPCAAISQIKWQKTIKKPFSPLEIERLKQSCTTLRDLALIEFLYASGCRVSEVIALNSNDINFVSNEAIVLGKGNKERIIYLTPVALMHLQDYLKSRKDSNSCLFATLKAPYNRLSKAGIESVLKKLGNQSGIDNVHPHRYRRTLATNLLNRGANIQDVAVLLGHADLKTTQLYCCISQNNVKAAYTKFAS